MKYMATFAVIVLLSVSLIGASVSVGQTIPPVGDTLHLPIVQNVVQATSTAIPHTPTPTATSTPVPPTATPTSPVPTGEVELYTWTFFRDGSDLMMVGGIINNTSNNVSLVRVGIALFDQNGAIVDTDYTYGMLDILEPGMSSPFSLRFYSPPSIVDFRWSTSWYNTDTELIVLDIPQGHGFIDALGVARATGLVLNQTSEEQELAYVVGVILDSGGYLLGANWNFISPSTLNPGEQGWFDIPFYSWPDSSNPDLIDAYMVIASSYPSISRGASIRVESAWKSAADNRAWAGPTLPFDN